MVLYSISNDSCSVGSSKNNMADIIQSLIQWWWPLYKNLLTLQALGLTGNIFTYVEAL